MNNRCWDNKEKRWLKSEEYLINNRGKAVVLESFHTPSGDTMQLPLFQESNRYFVSHGIGIKDDSDKHKEIFDGDFVKIISNDGDEDDFYISEIKYYSHEDYPSFDVEDAQDRYYESNAISYIKGCNYENIVVIGNKFENPDFQNKYVLNNYGKNE